MRILSLGLLLALSTSARSDEAGPPRGVIEGAVIDTVTHAALAGATVIVTSNVGYGVVAASSGPDGRFRISNLPRGSYRVLFVLGNAKDLHEVVPVSGGVATRIHGELGVSADEITVYEHLATTPPEPVASTVSKIPPYTDEAQDSNAWEVGWLLLEIDTGGLVSGFRFLHRPGHGLDRVAAEEVWKLRFTPARDGSGRPVPSQRLWKLEWPSYWWQTGHLSSHVGLGKKLIRPNPIRTYTDSAGRTRVAPVFDESEQFLAGSAHINDIVPCVNYAPQNPDVGTIQRDCSKPDLDKIFTEPLIPRPAGR